MNYPDALTCKRPPAANEIPATYEQYHYASLDVGDIDPSYQMLRYICDRFELNTEQRYWLAFLYATCYCGPTVYYMYNEFPDFENVDIGRMEIWWRHNRTRLYFQTDRRWVRSRNQFCDVFRSYRQKVGKLSQEQLFKTFKTSDPEQTYRNAFDEMSKVYQFGRFAMFLYLEAVHVVTGFPMRPHTLEMKLADSCRAGLALAIGAPALAKESPALLKREELMFLQKQFDLLSAKMQREDPRNTVWNIETSLCAYKKYRLGTRWVGFYLDRQADEIDKLQAAVTKGVNWQVLWDYRNETYKRKMLREHR